MADLKDHVAGVGTPVKVELASRIELLRQLASVLAFELDSTSNARPLDRVLELVNGAIALMRVDEDAAALTLVVSRDGISLGTEEPCGAIARLMERGMVEVRSGHYRATDAGLALLDIDAGDVLYTGDEQEGEIGG